MSYPYTDLPVYQERVSHFVDRTGLRVTAEVRLLDLISEVGEVAKESLKATNYGKEPFGVTDEWDGEIADVFFALICLANATNVNLDVALTTALEKYQMRLNAKGNASSGR